MPEESLHERICVVTGVRSDVGRYLVQELAAAGYVIHAIGRNPARQETVPEMIWHQGDLTHQDNFPSFSAPTLFNVASIWLLPDRIEQFHANGVRRIIAFSSTSRFSKMNSSSAAERALAESLARSEDAVAAKCERLGIAYTIFRPTLIYGGGQDRNVADIARFVKRFGIFPILGKGTGLRQPVHAADLAKACLQAVDVPATFNKSYDLSGGETLTYRQMVERVFQAMGRRPRVLSVPQPVFRLAIRLAHLVPKYRHLKPEMAMRMDQDLCFSHAEAEQDIGFTPRMFNPAVSK